ncbi:MAG: chorismate mutase, partial [Oscillospiraceae bacterium]|nr:chorismate mutase [Oscillospiraceae bacterium]
MELTDYRKQIDAIDEQLVRLFAERMQTAANIAAYKKEHGLPVLDAERERKKLVEISQMAAEGMDNYTVLLYSLLFELSRSYQSKLLGTASTLPDEIKKT